MARMPEIQELKRATELRSKLRAVSEAGARGTVSSRAGGQWSSQAAIGAPS